jgi:hypothetical protein
VLLNFIYVDILLTDMWMPQLIFSATTRQKSEGGLNDFLEYNGFGSKLLINNLGSSFVYMLLYLCLCALYLLSAGLSHFVPM